MKDGLTKASASNVIRILIADDHYLIREGFKKLISREIGMSLVGQAENSSQVLEFLSEHDCDVLVLDINMPGKSGLELLGELRGIAPQTKVLILTMQPEDRFAVRALKLGAFGFISKESAADELVQAIRRVHEGRKYVSLTLAEKLATDLSRDNKGPLEETLSGREFQVFRLIGAGKTMHEISESLSLSLSTVNTYRSRILEKMDMRSNAEIIHYAIKNNLVD